MRKERIEDMKTAPMRILVATDCLSEGINLQHLFTGVLHYDLPWNPNRLEQREGRVDRFGQMAKQVKAYLLIGKDNPIDGVVLNVILRKVREIKRSTGITVPFPDDSKSVMDAVLNSVLLNKEVINQYRSKEAQKRQTTLDFGAAVTEKEVELSNKIEKAAEREKRSRTLFAQHTVKVKEIEGDLKDSDMAIGDPEAVEKMVVAALDQLGVNDIQKSKQETHCYSISTVNIPEVLKASLDKVKTKSKPVPSIPARIKVSFKSPVPMGYTYWGRNHPFVEQLCHYMLRLAFKEEEENKILGRVSIYKTEEVKVRTTLVVFRVRNVIASVKRKNQQMVAEEVLVWGYENTLEDQQYLSIEAARRLLEEAKITTALPKPIKQRFFGLAQTELQAFYDTKGFDQLALERCQNLVEAHTRFQQAMGSKANFEVVTPVLPMDIMGVSILLPA